MTGDLTCLKKLLHIPIDLKLGSAWTGEKQNVLYFTMQPKEGKFLQRGLQGINMENEGIAKSDKQPSWYFLIPRTAFSLAQIL